MKRGGARDSKCIRSISRLGVLTGPVGLGDAARLLDRADGGGVWDLLEGDLWDRPGDDMGVCTRFGLMAGIIMAGGRVMTVD